MAKLKIYSEITDKDTKVFYSWFDLDAVCFEDVSNFIESIPEDDNDIDLYLHCPGGSCIEGFAMYDALRSSGKRITTVVDGLCASMGTILMMAAPKERRFAQQNASICIHNPYYMDYYQYKEQAHAEDLENMAKKMQIQADELRDIEKRILDMYVERTGTDAETLKNLMADDRFITAQKAQELGLVGELLEYNTDHKTSKNMSKVTVEAGIFAKMLAKLGISKVEDFEVKNKVVTAADGTELTIDREEGNPEVGDTASPDGEFVMEDGSTIIVADGVITEIKEKKNTDEEEREKEEDDDDDEEDKIEDLKAQIASLTQERDNLKSSVKTEEEVSALASIEGLNQKIVDLSSQVTALTEERDSLKASVKTDDEVAILDKISALGGMQWIEMAEKASSSFTPENGGFKGPHIETKDVTFDSYLEAKRASRKARF